MSSLLSKVALALFAALMMASCHESLEERAARESAEYTRKNCPAPVSEYIINDSIVYEKATRTIHYYYTITGLADTSAVNWNTVKAELIRGVKGSTELRAYKAEGFNFAYTYFSSKHKGRKLIDVRLTPKDYRRENKDSSKN